MVSNRFLWLPAVFVNATPRPAAPPRQAFGALSLLPQGLGPSPVIAPLTPIRFRGRLLTAAAAREDVEVPAAGVPPSLGVAGAAALAEARAQRRPMALIGPRLGPEFPQGAWFDFDAVSTAPDMTGTVWYRIAATSLPVVAGWSSDTGFRAATTAVQRAVIETVRGWPQWHAGGDPNAMGEASEASVCDPVLGARTWDTDVYDQGFGPATQLIALLTAIETWTAAQQPVPTVAAMVPAEQRTAWRALVPYWAAAGEGGRDDRALLVDQAIVCHLAKRATVPLPTAVFPAGASAVLAYLEFRADCRETADIVVRRAGGRCVGSYSETAKRGVAMLDVRPGMYAYYARSDAGGLIHTMLVSDAYWDAAGQLKQLRLAESNKGGGWGHPTGMVPWSRRRWRDRVVSVGQQTNAQRFHDAAGDRYYLVVDPIAR